jgi:hypothetical protein
MFPLGMSGQEIYENFKSGVGPERLQASGETIAALVKNYENRKTSISNLTKRMESAWQGDASGAAQRGAGPLAVEHGVAAPEMNTAQELVASQVAVYRFADATVVPVPAEPEKPGFWDNLLSAGQAGENYENQMTRVNAANDRNIAIMGTYEDVTSTNTSRMPTSYGSITPDHSAIGVQEQKEPPVPLPPKGRPPGTGGNLNQSNNVNNQVGQPPGPGGDQLLGPSRPPQQNQPNRPPNQQTDPSDFLPPGGPKPPGPGPVPPPGPGPNPPLTPTFFGPPGFGPTGGYADSSSRGGPGNSGARGFGGTAGEEGRGVRGPGAAAAEAAAGRGAGPGGGMGRGAGMGGMPMGGGGGARGQGQEDGAHQRPSYLVEGDPDETFGTDEVTAPPVIGE